MKEHKMYDVPDDDVKTATCTTVQSTRMKYYNVAINTQPMKVLRKSH
jgi:hypothetical protein